MKFQSVIAIFATLVANSFEPVVDSTYFASS